MSDVALAAPPCPSHRTQPSTDTCRGCGRFLCPKCGASDSRCPACASAEHPIPWEDRGRGRVGAFVATLRAMTRSGFFGRCPWSGGIARPLSFAVLCAVIAAFGDLVMTAATHALFSDELSVKGIKAAAETFARTAPPELADRYRSLGAALAEQVPRLRALQLRLALVTFLVAPLSALMNVFVMGALSHAVARLLGGRGTFEASLRVIAYAQAAVLLGLLPSVGGSLSFLVGLLAVTFGMREAQGLSLGRAFVVATWWIPVALAFGCVFLGLLVRALLGG